MLENNQFIKNKNYKSFNPEERTLNNLYNQKLDAYSLSTKVQVNILPEVKTCTLCSVRPYKISDSKNLIRVLNVNVKFQASGTKVIKKAIPVNSVLRSEPFYNSSNITRPSLLNLSKNPYVEKPKSSSLFACSFSSSRINNYPLYTGERTLTKSFKKITSSSYGKKLSPLKFKKRLNTRGVNPGYLKTQRGSRTPWSNSEPHKKGGFLKKYSQGIKFSPSQNKPSTMVNKDLKKVFLPKAIYVKRNKINKTFSKKQKPILTRAKSHPYFFKDIKKHTKIGESNLSIYKNYVESSWPGHAKKVFRKFVLFAKILNKINTPLSSQFSRKLVLIINKIVSYVTLILKLKNRAKKNHLRWSTKKKLLNYNQYLNFSRPLSPVKTFWRMTSNENLKIRIPKSPEALIMTKTYYLLIKRSSLFARNAYENCLKINSKSYSKNKNTIQMSRMVRMSRVNGSKKISIISKLSKVNSMYSYSDNNLIRVVLANNKNKSLKGNPLAVRNNKKLTNINILKELSLVKITRYLMGLNFYMNSFSLVEEIDNTYAEEEKNLDNEIALDDDSDKNQLIFEWLRNRSVQNYKKSKILYLKNNGLSNSVQMEVNSLNYGLPLKISIFESDKLKEKSTSLDSNLTSSVTVNNFNLTQPVNIFENKNTNLSDLGLHVGTNLDILEDNSKKDDEKKVIWMREPKIVDDYIFTRLKYNKSLLKKLTQKYYTKKYKEENYLNLLNEWKFSLKFKEWRRKESLFLNSYIYKKAMMKYFVSMPNIVKVLGAIKVARASSRNARKLNTTSSSRASLPGLKSLIESLSASRSIRGKVQQESFDFILKILGVNLKKQKVLKISINTLNLPISQPKTYTDLCWQPAVRAISEPQGFIKNNNIKLGIIAPVGIEVPLNGTNSVASFAYDPNPALLGEAKVKSSNLPLGSIPDQYIVNNLLLQKLILSKYRATMLRSKLLRYRLSVILGKNLFYSQSELPGLSQPKLEGGIVPQSTLEPSNLKIFKKEILIFNNKDAKMNSTPRNAGASSKIRRAIIKLHKGSSDKYKEETLNYVPNNSNYYINDLGKNKPNLRNLRIILRRYFISKPLPLNNKKGKINFKFNKLQSSNSNQILSLFPSMRKNQTQNEVRTLKIFKKSKLVSLARENLKTLNKRNAKLTLRSNTTTFSRVGLAAIGPHAKNGKKTGRSNKSSLMKIKSSLDRAMPTQNKNLSRQESLTSMIRTLNDTHNNVFNSSIKYQVNHINFFIKYFRLYKFNNKKRKNKIKINRYFIQLLLKSLVYKKISNLNNFYDLRGKGSAQKFGNKNNNFISILKRLSRSNRIGRLYLKSKSAKKIYKLLPKINSDNSNAPYELSGLDNGNHSHTDSVPFSRNVYQPAITPKVLRLYNRSQYMFSRYVKSVLFKRLYLNNRYSKTVSFKSINKVKSVDILQNTIKPKPYKKFFETFSVKAAFSYKESHSIASSNSNNAASLRPQNNKNKFKLIFNAYTALLPAAKKKSIEEGYAISAKNKIKKSANSQTSDSTENNLLFNKQLASAVPAYFLGPWGANEPKSYVINSLIMNRNKDLIKYMKKFLKTLWYNNKKIKKLNRKKYRRNKKEKNKNNVTVNSRRSINKSFSGYAYGSKVDKTNRKIKNIKSGTVIKMSKVHPSITSLKVKDYNRQKSMVRSVHKTTKGFNLFMRKNFVNYMLQNYIFNSMRYPKGFVLSSINKGSTLTFDNTHAAGSSKVTLKNPSSLISRLPSETSEVDYSLVSRHSPSTRNRKNKNNKAIYASQMELSSNLSESIPVTSEAVEENILDSGFVEIKTNSGVWNKLNLRKKMPFLTLSNRFPGLTNSTDLFIHSNIYNVIERNTYNFKFKLNYPKFNYKIKLINNNKFSNKLLKLWQLGRQNRDGFINYKKEIATVAITHSNNLLSSRNRSVGLKIKKTSLLEAKRKIKRKMKYSNEPKEYSSSNRFSTKNLVHTQMPKNLNTTLNYENQELLDSTINYWLLEQEKQSKRSFMNPHLSLLNNNRATSFQYRVNFLKLNQLGFLYSKGLIKEKIVISKFLDKILKMDLITKKRLSLVVHSPFTDFIKKYRKKHKKGYMKKNLSRDIKTFKSLFYKNIYFDTYFTPKNLHKVIFKKETKNLPKNRLKSDMLKRLIENKNNTRRRGVPKFRLRNFKIAKSLRKYKLYLKINKKKKKKYKYLMLKSSIIKKRIKDLVDAKNTLVKKRSKLPFIYSFLINKKMAIDNFTLFFKLETYFFDAILTDKSLKLKAKYGKKALKTLGIKTRGRRKFKLKINKLIKLFKKIIPHYIFKLFLLLIWRRSVRGAISPLSGQGLVINERDTLNENYPMLLRRSLKDAFLITQRTQTARLINTLEAKPLRGHKNIRQASRAIRSTKVVKKKSEHYLNRKRMYRAVSNLKNIKVLYDNFRLKQEFKTIYNTIINKRTTYIKTINKPTGLKRLKKNIKKHLNFWIKLRNVANKFLSKNFLTYNNNKDMPVIASAHNFKNDKKKNIYDSILHSYVKTIEDLNLKGILGLKYKKKIIIHIKKGFKEGFEEIQNSRIVDFNSQPYGKEVPVKVVSKLIRGQNNNLNKDKEIFNNALAYLGNYFWSHKLSGSSKSPADKLKWMRALERSSLQIRLTGLTGQDTKELRSDENKRQLLQSKRKIFNSKSMLKRKKFLNQFKVKLIYNNFIKNELSKPEIVKPIKGERLSKISLLNTQELPFMKNSIPSLFKSLESSIITQRQVPALRSGRHSRHSPSDNNNSYNPVHNLLNSDISMLNLVNSESPTVENLELSGSLSPFFDFLIDNKSINLKNKLGLRKIFSEFKFFRYLGFSGVDTGSKQIITYSFTKNISRTNTLNSFDHTGSLLKVSISVILKYFFKLMGSALISKPVFVFSHNKVTIQINYFIYKKVYFSNKNTKNWNESVSTMSMGMQFYWPIILKNYADIPKRNMPKSGDESSRWRMNYFNIHRKPFNESVQPVYPGNLPYLAQHTYSEFVFRRFKKLRKLAGGYFDHKTKKYVLNPIENANYDRIKYSKPYVKNTLSFFYKELNFLTYILENFFNTPIKLELSQIKTPYSDPNIMAQLIGINGEENNFERIKRFFLSEFFYWNPNDPKNKWRFNNNNPKKPFLAKRNTSRLTEVSGIRVRVAGRFYKHRIIPRKTVSQFQRGSMARRTVGAVEKARYINKSKRGSFAITVWISYNF